jgi:DNA repair protein RecN (Recombination protein N)
MLRELRVRNLALLEDAHVVLGPGLNVVTGATGAGKSLLLSALTLLLGGRFSKEMLRTGTDQAHVEGIFDLADDDTVRRAADLLGDDAGGAPREVVVRRRVDASGKNRCEIDGRLVSVGELRDLGRLVCEIHGQSEHQALLEAAEQTLLLDRAAKLGDERAAFAARLAEWRELRERVAALRTGERERGARIESLEALVREVRGADLRTGEHDELRRERALLAEASRHAEALAEAAALLDGTDDEDGAVDRIGRAARGISPTADLSDDVRAAQEALDLAQDRLAEASRLLAAARDRIQADPARLETVEERLAAIGRVLRRHGPGEEEALAALAKAERELDDLTDEGGGTETLTARLADAERDLVAAGVALNEKRRKAAKPFASAVKKALADLGMAGTQFVVEVRDGDASQDLATRATELGLGAVEFLASPNAGEEIRPLARIASGGELARVALAIKGELARAASLDGGGAMLLVFDEIDADVGPRLGTVIGRRLAEVARGRQALVVTHLPQVAAFADVHLRVTKRTAAGRTTAHVEPIEAKERELEIAEMIRGEGRGKEALDQARSMIAERAKR